MTALRRLLGALIALASVGGTPHAATATVTTLLGIGVPGYSDTQVNNPYGIVLGPDGALYFCDLDNQGIRRFSAGCRGRTACSPARPALCS